MGALAKDLTLERGYDFDRVFEWHVSSGGALMDLSSYSAQFQIGPDSAISSAWITATSSNGGGITLGGALGTIRVQLASSVTSSVPANGHYKLTAASAAGVRTKIAHGVMKLDD